MENIPALWLNHFPFPNASQHKYDRGHVVVSGGGIACTGAACLAATAALRVGAGVVTVAAPTDALMVYAIKLTSVMARPCPYIGAFKDIIIDPRVRVVVLGPGNGVSRQTAKKAELALTLKKSCVIDADAITAFANKPSRLFDAICSPVVLTPHEGEFVRLFDCQGSRIERAQAAAKKSKAVVVLKGSETVIASPDGRYVVNNNAPATLATAGSGDVLSGIIAGLMAQGMEAFMASCSAVWLHSKAAQLSGMGMISEDLLTLLPSVIKQIHDTLELELKPE